MDLDVGNTRDDSKKSSQSARGQPQIPKPTKDNTPTTEGRTSNPRRNDSDGTRPTGSSNSRRDPPSESPKPKRVRTGCLTCRKRHLKCDEALPRCLNCQKSGRVCARGLRLNFIDTQTVELPHNIPHPPGIQLAFQDESREIASEYTGGFERYPPLKEIVTTGKDSSSRFEVNDILEATPLTRQIRPISPASLVPAFPESSQPDIEEPIFSDTQYSTSVSNYPSTELSHSQFQSKALHPPAHKRPFLSDAEEVLLMQVFVEEVGLWMDSMDTHKHVWLGQVSCMVYLYLTCP